MISNKEVYIDYLKAFSIILVIVGHALSYYSITYQPLSQEWRIMELLIYSVHVQLFFVIAGFLCHRQKVLPFYKKKIFRILIPFFTFSILKLVYSNCISNHFIHANGLREQIIDAFVYGNLYWFCYAIFLIFLLSPVLWTKHGTGITRISIYIVITFAVFSSVSQLLNLTFSNIFQIVNAIYYFPFFAAGYYIYQHKTHFEETIQKNSIFLSLLSALIVFGYLSFVLSDTVKDTFFPAKFIVSFALMYFLLNLAKALPENMAILKCIGKYSLQLMLFDSFYKVLLFGAFSGYMTGRIWMCFILSAINLTMGCISCLIIRKIPYVNSLVGL